MILEPGSPNKHPRPLCLANHVRTMPSFCPLVLVLFSLIAFVASHREPKTPQEVEVQRSLQAAAYHARFAFSYCFLLTLFIVCTSRS